MIENNDILHKLLYITDNVLVNEPMCKHTSFRVGGVADFLVTIENKVQLNALFDVVQRYGIPVTVIGRGTNVIVRDKGIRGIVTRLGGEFNKIVVDVDNFTITAGAGVSLNRVVKKAVEYELSGMEFGVDIPGTIGGAVVGNVGIKDNCIGEKVNHVEVFSPESGICILNRKDVSFSYRDSNLRKYIVLNVELLLTKQNFLGIISVMDLIRKQRLETQPKKVIGSAGSIFKNPDDNIYAGKLIEEAGLKGCRIGKAYVSRKHANFILTDKGAKAQDILDLMEYIQEKVYKMFGIKLIPEVIVIGEK